MIESEANWDWVQETLDFELAPLEWRAIAEHPFMPVRRLLGIVFFALVFGRIYAFLRSKLPVKVASRLVALLHAVWGTLASLYVVFNKHWIFELPASYCTKVPLCDEIFTVTVGYFCWDLTHCLSEAWTIDFLVHAVMSILIFGATLVFGVFQRCGILSLFIEVSTIFLHTYVLLFKYKHPDLAEIFRLIFAITFTFSRFVVGSFVTYEMWRNIVFDTNEIFTWCGGPRFVGLPYFGVFLNSVIHVLNMYWMIFIVRGVVKTVCCGDHSISKSEIEHEHKLRKKKKR